MKALALQRARAIAVLLWATCLPVAVLADAPKVVSTDPANGDLEVDPETRVIRVEFDQPMSRGGFSICGGGDPFPKIIGNPKWESDRVLVMRVKLVPGHDYQFSINCPSAQNFRGTNGEAAEIYPVHFRTAGADAAAERVDPKVQRDAVNALRKALDDFYSYRDLRGVDWDAEFKTWRQKLIAARTAEQFASYAGQLLAAAKDKHIWLKVGEKTFPSYRQPVAPNVNLEKLKELVPSFKQRAECVYSGKFEDGIGYLAITGLPNEPGKALDMALMVVEMFSDAPGLIIDVRLNGGGSETVALQIAGCFVDAPVKYAEHVYRDPTAEGGFGPKNERMLLPNRGGPRYRGKVAVLTGPVVMSSCEAFILMMKQVPQCKLIGETSQGASGNPKEHELPNGVVVYLPSWRSMTPDGESFEGKGIPPDIEVKTTPADLEKGDPVLERALKYLRS